MNVEAATNVELDAKVIEIDAGQGAATLWAVHNFLGRFVRYPSPHAQVAHTLWCAHAHCTDFWHITPRLAFMSAEKESGKTRALEVTELLTPGALLSFNLSPAALVRKVAEGGCTILFDEIDALFGSSKRQEDNAAVQSVLNSGYKRGAKALRCVKVGKGIELEELPAFAPVALAGLKSLPDTLASRTIIVRMRRRAPDEAVEQFRLRHVLPIAAAVYHRLETWCRSLELADAEPEMPPGVIDRAAECWEPLLALADGAGGDWPRLARDAALHFVKGGRDEATSPGVELLAHCREAFGEETGLWTVTLLERLHNRDESPWKDIRGKPLDDRGLGSRLKPFSIKSCDVKVNGTNRKGYKAEHFYDAWKRYLTGNNDGASDAPVPPTSATSATSATNLNDQNKKVAQVALVALRDKCAQCKLDDGQTTPHDIGGSKVYLHRECAKFYRAG